MNDVRPTRVLTGDSPQRSEHRARELLHLQLADAHIFEAHDRLARQRALIARLKEQGRDLTMAKSVLRTMTDTLMAMEEHRQLILKEMGSGEP